MQDPANILIIEDERALADLYAEWLADSYTVSIGYTGEAALEKLDHTIDIVLLDRRLPGRSGDEILEEINNRHLDVEVAIVSAVTPDFAVLGLGIEDYLHKPVERDELLSLVEGMIERATRTELRQELERLQAKISTLETVKSEAELLDSDEYVKLVERHRRLRERVRGLPIEESRTVSA